MIAPAEVVLFASAGFSIGVFTGLIPGLHVNNAALLLASSVPALASASVPPEAIAVMIVAAAVSHTFLDIVPSVLVGAPEPSTALAVLPGHRLLMEGRASEAIRLSALGSGAAVFLALLLALPIKLLFEEIYPEILPYLGWLLLLVSAIMVVSETGDPGPFEVPSRSSALKARGWALGLFLLSGCLGYVALRGDSLGAPQPLLGVDASILFPLLTGLFGTSTVVLSLASDTDPPNQSADPVGLPRRVAARSIAGGTLSGTLVGWLPGVTSAQAAVLAGELSGEKLTPNAPEGARSYIVSVSAVNSSNAVFTLVALYTIGRARSGAMVAFEDVVPVSAWAGGLPPLLGASLMVVAVSGFLSYITLVGASDPLSRTMSSLNYRYLSLAVLVALSSAAFLLTGFFGLQVLAVATAMGLLPPKLGVRRTHLMGCLLLPIMMFFFGLRG
ncbi:MAG: hypothetical protein MAG715_00146 [Methanonatronarchaeales archaeon]|nr:hypothetical protein [Methanonatronarchaeales archaeon]